MPKAPGRFPPTWSAVKAFTENSVFKGAGAVLLVGTLAAAVFEHLRHLIPNAGAPLTFKVAFLGSLIGAGSVALFGWLCPKIIKHAHNFEAYLKEQWDIYMNANDDEKLNVVLTHMPKLDDTVRSRIRALQEKRRAGTLSSAEQTEANEIKNKYFPTAVQYHLNKLWTDENRSKPMQRLILVGVLGLSWSLSLIVFLYRAAQLLLF